MSGEAEEVDENGLTHEQKHVLVMGKVDGMYVAVCTCDAYDWQTDDREMLLSDHWLHVEFARGPRRPS